MGKLAHDNIALIISLLVGLNMLWAELVRFRSAKMGKRDIDATTLKGKEIDDEMAFRKDILEQNKNLTVELRETRSLLNASQSSIMTQAVAHMDKEMSCFERLDKIADRVEFLIKANEKLVGPHEANSNQV